MAILLNKTSSHTRLIPPTTLRKVGIENYRFFAILNYESKLQ